jgi:hypothetical protein
MGAHVYDLGSLHYVSTTKESTKKCMSTPNLYFRCLEMVSILRVCSYSELNHKSGEVIIMIKTVKICIYYK